MEQKINNEDFVWAKISRFPPWPAMVLEPNQLAPEKPTSKSNSIYHWIYFFGSHDYAWIEENNIKPYQQFRDKFTVMYKMNAFKEAVAEIDEHIQSKEEDPDYIVPIVAFKEIHNKRPKTPNQRSARKRLKNGLNHVDRPSKSIHNEPDWCETLETANLSASSLTFGVIGIGIIGSHVVKNLVKSGHKVNIWNRDLQKCEDIDTELKDVVNGNLMIQLSARSLLFNSDIVFVCISDHVEVKLFIQNNFGINNASDYILEGKGLVVMTGIDPETSKDIRDMIEKKQGKYLEAQIQWGDVEDETEDTLVLLTAGDKSLFYDCQSCLKAISIYTMFLGDVGYASKIYLILQNIKGVCLGALVEAMFLAKRSGIREEDVLCIFNQSQLNCKYLRQKIKKIVLKNFSSVEQSLQNMQQDLKLGLDLSSKVSQPMNVTTIVNELFKHCQRLGYGSRDASAIYMRNQH